MPNCLVATDMDGTLLNHHDYRYDAALPCLHALEQRGIPVILNTSKTFAELQQWRERLSIRHPFIVENGSAIFLPPGYFDEVFLSAAPVPVTEIAGFRVLVCGKPIDRLRSYLREQKVEADDLSSCSLQEAIAMTGLPAADAALAQNRNFSIPLRFANPALEQRFAERALNDGFGILKGGRFLHLIGETDKGHSQQILRQLYEKSTGDRWQLIAMGDSPNDIHMLESADIAVLVNSPSSGACQISHQQLIRTNAEAPEGWVEGIERAMLMVDDKPQTGAN